MRTGFESTLRVGILLGIEPGSKPLILYVHVYHVIAKIRFELGKLVQKLVSEGEKSRFRALEIEFFSGEHVPRIPLGGSCFTTQCFFADDSENMEKCC